MELHANIPLAHAARCPCRQQNEQERSDRAGPSSSSSPPPSCYPLFRLAVVVLPTVISSVTSCSKCSDATRVSSHSDSLPAATRVLLTHRPRHMRAFPGCWVFPGGACDPNDSTLDETGIREVQEETGLRITTQHTFTASLATAPSSSTSQLLESLSSPRSSSSSSSSSLPLVSLWEAVYPVIRSKDHERFVAKARYLIAMYAGQVEQTNSSNETGTHCSSNSNLPNSILQSSSSSSSSPSICLNCSLPLKLCPTEVDAGVWLTGTQFDRLRAHAEYYHTEDEEGLQSIATPSNSSSSASPTSLTHMCQISSHPHEPCDCDWIPARVTESFANQHPTQTRIDQVEAIHPDTPATVDPFLRASVRLCTLFGLYPNCFGSGVAEGHLVALEEMREKGWI